ncbi:MAG: radical SAM protein [Candidatus Omnitrophica bacterium]|nr:radical SAM protein [Candidatus Omnitrophota bacterium]
MSQNETEYVRINKDQFSMDTPERERKWEETKRDFKAYCVNRYQWFNYPKWQYINDFPLHVDFEASFRCNLKCPMCFRPHIRRKDWNDMDFNLFKKGIDECAANNLYSIRLNWRGEPTVNPHLIEMVAYAKQKGIKDVSFITNGKLIDRKYAAELVKAGLDYITYSIDSMYAKYEELRFPIKFDEITRNVRDMHDLRETIGNGFPRIKIQAIWSFMKDQSQEFYNYFKDITDLIAFNTYDDYTLTFMPQNPALICQYLWQRINITWSGEAPMCISDWDLATSVGDLRNESIKEMWHGKKMNEYRKMHSSGKRLDLDCCKRCHRLAVPNVGNKPAGKDIEQVGSPANPVMNAE